MSQHTWLNVKKILNLLQNGHTIPIEKVDIGFETGGMNKMI